MAVELESGGLHVIHAMPLRKKYRTIGALLGWDDPGTGRR